MFPAYPPPSGLVIIFIIIGFGTKSPLKAAGSKLRSMGGSRVRVADNFVAAARTAWRVLRQTAALGCIESSPRRADDGDARECPAARTVEEPAARCGLPAGPHTELPTQNHTRAHITASTSQMPCIATDGPAFAIHTHRVRHENWIALFSPFQKYTSNNKRDTSLHKHTHN